MLQRNDRRRIPFFGKQNFNFIINIILGLIYSKDLFP